MGTKKNTEKIRAARDEEKKAAADILKALAAKHKAALEKAKDAAAKEIDAVKKHAKEVVGKETTKYQNAVSKTSKMQRFAEKAISYLHSNINTEKKMIKFKKHMLKS